VSRRQNERLVELGVVGRPHGVRGEVRVFLHNSDSDILREVEHVLLDCERGAPRTYAITSVRATGKHQLVGLEGVTSREAADRLKGARLLLPREQLPPLDEGELYVDDLIGLDVVCENRVLGAVRASREQGGVEVLTVVAGDEEIEIPLVEQYVVEVSLEQARIEVRDVDQLPRNERDHKGRRRDG
jgi:16S rRNA processing protein RimM